MPHGMQFAILVLTNSEGGLLRQSIAVADALDLSPEFKCQACRRMNEETRTCQPYHVILVGNGIFGRGMPNRIIGPSTIQSFSATRLSVFNGG